MLLTLFAILIAISGQVQGDPPLLFTGENQARPGLGINLGLVDSGMAQWVFTNKFKHAKEWRPCGSNNDWANYSWTSAFNTSWSEDGYPLTFNHNPYVNSRQGYQTELGTYGTYPTGDYVVTYLGTGNITLLGDATNVRMINSNKFEFTVSLPSKKGIILIITKPNVTNIDLREKIEETSTQTFGTKFIDAIKIFGALRFSSWMVRSSNADKEWSTRRLPSYYTQVGQQMISIEYIVELANVLSKDIWLSIPSSASQDYIVKIAEYVKLNLVSNTSLIYVEQSSDKVYDFFVTFMPVDGYDYENNRSKCKILKGFNGNNKTLNMQLIQSWKSVFGNDTRVKYILSTWLTAYYDNTVSMYTDDELKQFDGYAVSGTIAYGSELNYDNYNITDAAAFTIENITNIIRQQIYKDEIALIYHVNKISLKFNITMYGYDVGFNLHAPGFSDRWKQTNNSDAEQKLEDLIIEAFRQPIIEDLYLDFMERWYRLGGGFMFLSNIVDYVNRCEKGGGKCGYKSTLENLNQIPSTVPKYRAAQKWLNGEKGSLPFTSDDLPQTTTTGAICASCVWGTCYQGKCYCFDGYSGPSCDQLGSKYLDCSSDKTEYGVNLNGIPDWSTEVTFVDLQRRARKWIVHKIVFQTAWAELDQEDIQLRDDGYPKYLEIGKTIGTFLTRDLNAHYPNGDYVCLYDGDGVLEFPFLDVKITRRDAGRIEMTVNHKTEMNNGIYYNIIRTNPSNPIRNIRLFEAKYESVYEKFPFYPYYLEFLRKFKTLRLMPMSRISIDQDIDWSNRTLDSFYTFTLKTGVSLEKQVLLCNTLGANPWFNLPHRATDQYITNWAQYVKEKLRPDVKVYIEIGNECWGSGDAHVCGNYAQKMGYAENMTLKANQSYYSKELVGRICYHAKTGKRILEIVKQVFGSSYNRDRIQLVLNTQAAWSGPLEIFFLCQGNYYESFDIISIAPYMSYSMKKADGSLVSIDEFFNTTVHNAINESLALVKKIYSFVNSNSPSLKLALYEAGPDFSSLFDQSNTALTEMSIAVHRDQRMYQALRYYISNLTKTDGIKLSAYVHYASITTFTKYGCWGLTESSDSNLKQSPKYIAYIDHIDAEKICDWSEKENVCENDCSSAGVCTPNPLTSKKDSCFCNFGSSGQKCESPNYVKSERCTYLCNGKGECSYNHTEGFYLIYTCHCKPGYYGYGCELFECANECNFNGKCVDNDTCTCYKGFKGKYCEIDCGCKGHGSCSNSTNECVCESGYTLVQGQCELDCSANISNPDCAVCPNCGFGTCVKGSCVCWAGYGLDNKKSCTIKVRAKNDGSKLGINLNGVVDWGTQWAFVDLGKQARNWIVQHIDYLNTLYIWSLAENITLTSERYPAQVPKDRQLVTLMLRDVQQRWPNGVYHVFYDGEGVLDFDFDAKIIDNSEKYKMKIQVTLSLVRDNGVFMKIKKSNPKNPIRNIRIVMDGFQDIYSKIPFHPLFMERLSMFRTIRFMPWTEEHGIVKWTDRITMTSFTQGQGVAFEYQILLSNLMKTNPWFIVPYAADDDFVSQMATLVLNTLRKDLTIYVEYTNEGWNSFFNSGKYCEEMGLKLGLSQDKTEARNLYYSKRSKEIITIWKNVFSNEQSRIVWVIGSFFAMPIMSTRILEYQNAYSFHTNTMLALTGYISCESPSAAFVANADMSVLFAKCDSDLPNIRKTLEMHYNISKKYNVNFGMYEWGTGMSELQAIFDGSETPGATDKYLAMNRDIRMYKVYKDYFKMYSLFNMTETCHYAYVETPSKYGTWELLEYQTQSAAEAHRYRAVLDLLNETRANLTDFQDIYCFGKLLNASDVCDGKGTCVAPDQCVPFAKPTRNSQIELTPRQGIALVENFLFYTDAWTSDTLLKYAFGINLPDTGYVRLTDFIETPRAVTLLPFIGQEYQVVLFVQDTFGNIYNDVSSQNVNVLKYNDSANALKSLIANFTLGQKLIALYDKSYGKETVTTQVIDNIDLSSSNLTNSLSNLQYLTNKLNNQSTALNAIGDKIENLFSNMSSTLASSANKTLFSYGQSSSLIGVISSIYEQGSSKVAEKLIQNFTSLILKSDQNDINETINGLPTTKFMSKSFNLTLATFDISKAKSSGYVNYTDITADLSQVFANGDPSLKGNIALVKLSADSSQSVVSNQIDLKFYSNGSLLSVKNLSNPITLQFSVDDSSISVMNNPSSGYKLKCKYYDEVSLTWSSDGCTLTGYNTASKQINCNCTHTTKFSIVMEKSDIVSTIIQTTNQTVQKSAAVKANFSTTWILILLLFIFFV